MVWIVEEVPLSALEAPFSTVLGTYNVYYASRNTQKWKQIIPECPVIGQQDDSSFTSSLLEHSAKNSIGAASEECESAGLAKKLM